MDTIYASFEDAVIRFSDLQLLSSPFWLNDALVGFFFEYLAKHVYKTSDSVCFMHPATACLISSFSNEDALVIKQVLHPLDLSKFELIFIPVSDGTGEYAGSGTHWSLLLYSSRQMQWQHYDSSRSANAKPSRNLARIIDAIFDNRQGQSKFKEMTCPQQRNGYDCGPHVMALAKVIAESMIDGQDKDVSLADAAYASNMRVYLREIIEKYRK